jgi:hypothetical protein
MSGWKKHFKVANFNNLSPISGDKGGNHDAVNSFGFKNYQSSLPDVYVGHPNRIERYNQYEQMDADSEINAALDILAEFSTQANIENGTAFDIKFNEPPTDNEIKIIKEQLQQWCNLNEFDKRIFKLFRNVLKYGDQVFIRDPENFKLLWTEMSKVTKVIVNESDGKKPEQYVVKELNPNLENLTVTAVTTSDTYMNSPTTGGQGGALYSSTGGGGGAGGSRFSNAKNEAVINAEHVVHISLTEGLDAAWPFGTSVLETVFKVFKQKELLEDSIIIYRVQRAPERRVFKIDVGNMPTHLAMAFVERVKNEVHQRRIPTQSGGGTNMMDATYNPLSMNEDYFFPQTADGRGSSVDTLPGGQNLGEITDLRFFTNKLFRGLRIPSSYLPTQTDEAANSFSDGKVGMAMIQEWRFNQYCLRLQKLMAHSLDGEFKLFLRFRGINIDSSVFDLQFNEPQNFTKYRQVEIDNARISTFSQLEQIPYLSKRFLMTRYLGLSEEEMQENEKSWAEEHADADTAKPEDANLRSVGVSAGGLGADLENVAPVPEEGGEEGAPMGGEGGAAPGVPGAPVAAGGAPGMAQ